MRLFPALLTAVLCLFAAQSWAVETITLQYGWEPGTHAKVTGTASKEKFLNNESQGVVSMDISYFLVTTAHEQGLQIDFSNAEVTMSSGAEDLPPFMQSYMESLFSSMPSYVIDPEGAVVGIPNLDTFREAAVSGIEAMLTDVPDEVRTQLIGGLSQVFSEDVLHAQVEEEWGKHVGQWIGAELDNGGVYQMEYEAPIPLLNNQLVKTYAEYEFVDRVNCDDLDTENSCVFLLYRTQTDDLAATALLQQLLGDLAVAEELIVSISTEVELVTDPESLLTYYSKSVKSVSTPAQTPEGLVNTQQLAVSEFKYVYAK